MPNGQCWYYTPRPAELDNSPNHQTGTALTVTSFVRRVAEALHAVVDRLPLDARGAPCLSILTPSPTPCHKMEPLARFTSTTFTPYPRPSQERLTNEANIPHQVKHDDTSRLSNPQHLPGTQAGGNRDATL